MAKNFLFDNFYQCPVALITTFALMSAQVDSTTCCSLFLPFHLTLSNVSMAPNLRPDQRWQAFTTPYASTMLDRLQTCAYGSQFLILFIGMLFATDRGEEGTKTHDMLKLVFYLIFWTMGSIASLVGLRDIWCVRHLTRPYSRQ